MGALNDLAVDCYTISRDHGFWEGKDPFTTDDVLVKHALIHSEVSEALEEARTWAPDGDHTPSQDAHDEEMVDVIIRALDLLGARGADVDAILARKMEKNRGRPYMHGKSA